MRNEQENNTPNGLILFGAGASHGCGDILPEPPPLGRQLFDKLTHCYPPSWGKLPKGVREAFLREGFEKGMALLYKSYNVLGLMSHMGHYFVQFRPKRLGSTTYAGLAQRLRGQQLESRLVLSTLNYDCILELELDKVGIPFDYGLSQRKEGQLSVLKPHGSCNFLPVGISGPSGSISMGYQAVIDCPMRPEADLEKVDHCLTNPNPLPPVMCYFMEGKPVQVATSAVKQIQKRWQECAQAATAIVIVGVDVNPEDTHIWDFVTGSKGAVGYVARPDSAKRFLEWCQKTRPQHVNIRLGKSFQGSVEAICDFLEEYTHVPQRK